MVALAGQINRDSVTLRVSDGRESEIALGKGKGEHDKRDTIKEREGKREVERAMKERHR